MRYSQFKIETFRGIGAMELDFAREPSGPVYTLVGLNESGKTTILQALHWFYDQSHYATHDLIPKPQQSNFNGSVRVTATLEFEEGDKKELASIAKKQAGWRLDELSDSITLTRVAKYEHSKNVGTESAWNVSFQGRSKKGRLTKPLHPNSPTWERLVAYIEKEMIPPVIYYENFLFDFPDRIYLRYKPDVLEEAGNEQYRLILQDVLNSIDTDLSIETHLLDRYDSGGWEDKDNIQHTLNDAAAKVTEVVLSAWRDYVTNDKAGLEVVLPGLEEDEKGIFVAMRVKEGRNQYYIRERSLGFRWFFSFILLTHFRTYRDNQRQNALFLLDEPASNLHPTAQMKLLDVFGSLPNRQTVMYSTHSHHMIRPKWLAGAYVVNNEARDYSGLDIDFNARLTNISAERYYAFVSTHPQDTDLYQPILEALDYRPGPLELVPSIIFVEGKQDYFTLRYVTEILGVAELVAGGIFPGTGRSKMKRWIELYLAWGRPFVALFDADDGGKRSSRRLQKELKGLLANRVLTLADVNSEWDGLTTPDLFDEKDKTKIVEAVYGEGSAVSKASLGGAIEASLVREVEIAPQIQTRTRFARLVEHLNSVLAARVNESQN